MFAKGDKRLNLIIRSSQKSYNKPELGYKEVEASKREKHASTPIR